MGQRCTVCTHPERDAINRKLLNPSISLAQAAEGYDLTRAAMDRHRRNHLKLSAELAHEARNALTVVGFASDLHKRAVAILDRAEAVLSAEDASARSVQAAAASLREVRGSIELLARLVVTAPPEPEPAGNSWLDAALTEAVAALAPPALPPGRDAIADAQIIDAPD